MTEHLSTLTLDALAAGALDAAAAARAEQHLAACERCRADAAALGASRERFAQSVLPRTLPLVRERLNASRRAPRWLWLAVPALAAVALALVFGPLAGIGTSPIDGDLRIKGDVSLQVIARRGDRIWSVGSDNRVATGDAVRFVVAPGGARFVLIASVDGAGAVTIYHPYGGAESAPLTAGERIELPGSIVLDDAPGPERIVAVFTGAPLPADDVRAALAQVAAGGPDAIRAAATIAGLPGAQASVLLEKAAP